ncbi:excinuclease ABC subunit UvrC [Cesiribacter andamanensis]|uniref:UvrABC system protein C n=1 Tax=Cesiribacter andamanensis AMV16 TaxID=1279009 RepID=M7N3P3_9BACT|nr:excinuclease ABC subunit UvrC [Cesiribacter andamanensis]EMR01826.1 Excinuclease ABC subunit C [Cesiribacter andamanensis AMV16]
MYASYYTPDQIGQLPSEPGIYKYYDAERHLIYVGKAKNLKKRVSSYFNKQTGVDKKTRKLVSEIHYIEFTIVNTEFEALLLENTLIKENQPKYNILLRDDKSYPYICVTHERFPRVFAIRRFEPGLGTYYGPFASVKAMNNVFYLLRSLYHIRTCKYNLSEENIQKGKFKVCLEYHIGNCKGPCEGLQSEQDYNRDIEQVVHVLKGNLAQPRQYFRERMQEAAGRLEFEQAQRYKEKFELLEKYHAKSLVVNPNIADVDVFTITSDEKCAFINYLKVINGAITVTKTVEVKKKLEESDADILVLVMIEMRSRYNSQSREIISNIPIELEVEDWHISVPKIGDKRKLVELSFKNALFFKKERMSVVEDQKGKPHRVVLQLQKDLQLKNPPLRIECFDNSNIQGTNPVSAMVCFINGKPAKSEYRHYNIQTVEGPNDFASMHEVVSRRYKRLLEEKKPLPDLIVVDGGKGQLSAATDALKELGIYGQVPIIGIAKRLEELYFPEDPYPLHIDKKSESLMLLQRARDEAHRFAITHHRQKRSKAAFESQLENISGIGEVTASKLLKHFRSVQKIKEAPVEEIAKLIGKDKAQRLKETLNQGDSLTPPAMDKLPISPAEGEQA